MWAIPPPFSAPAASLQQKMLYQAQALAQRGTHTPALAPPLSRVPHFQKQETNRFIITPPAYLTPAPL